MNKPIPLTVEYAWKLTVTLYPNGLFQSHQYSRSYPIQQSWYIHFNKNIDKLGKLTKPWIFIKVKSTSCNHIINDANIDNNELTLTNLLLHWDKSTAILNSNPNIYPYNKFIHTISWLILNGFKPSDILASYNGVDTFPLTDLSLD